MGRALVLACALLVGLASAARGEGSFHLKDGDRVLFYGDSITERGLYTAIVETYVATRYPELDVSFVNASWSGDMVRGGRGGPIDVRLGRDVLPHRPTVMTIMLGMNDRHPSLGAGGANDRQFFDGYAHIISRARADLPGVRITVLTPSPYDEVTRPPRPEGDNAVLVRFGRWIEDYARSGGLEVADMNVPLVRVLERANEANPNTVHLSSDAVHFSPSRMRILLPYKALSCAFLETEEPYVTGIEANPEGGAKGIIPDRIHPGLGGALIMAEQLKAWHARSVVAGVAIDASSTAPALSSVEHSRVSDLSAGDGVSWIQLDDALPLPFAEWERAEPDGRSVSLVIRCSDVTAALNEQPLRVTGLKEGAYTLRIDGAAVGMFSGAELAEGVNLAVLDTPMARQAKQVYDLSFAHNAVRQASWRQIEVLLAGYDLPQRKARRWTHSEP